ncbi:MAG: hypothetical protein ACREBR_04845 [bacterium]
MKVFVVYQDQDNSCCDPDCCGGPSPWPTIKVFSSLDKATEAGHKLDEVKEIEVDKNEWEDVGR